MILLFLEVLILSLSLFSPPIPFNFLSGPGYSGKRLATSLMHLLRRVTGAREDGVYANMRLQKWLRMLSTPFTTRSLAEGPFRYVRIEKTKSSSTLRKNRPV